jgi:uncharacterized protein YfaQ (DUF2300 family)
MMKEHKYKGRAITTLAVKAEGNWIGSYWIDEGTVVWIEPMGPTHTALEAHADALGHAMEAVNSWLESRRSQPASARQGSKKPSSATMP